MLLKVPKKYYNYNIYIQKLKISNFQIENNLYKFSIYES